MLLDLIKLGIGAGIGATGCFFLLRRWFANYAEYEAWSSYQVGFASGKKQGRWDSKRKGLIWVERN
jgi:hypothetical protein